MRGFGQDALFIQATTVVAQVDDDVAAGVIRGQPHRTGRRLARRDARRGRLDAVVGGVAHHVNQRLGDDVNHIAVDFGIVAGAHELNQFVALLGDVAHDTRQLLESRAQRHHAQRHRHILQFAHDFAGVTDFSRQLRIARHVVARIGGQHGVRDH